ncbi:MAG: 50S ribosomal protein L7/L12 [Rickettsiaceae bacterium]|nr:MAG: 50S ribosomal protein L7/L12 [Rickettsiaceae bacterium]
MDLNEIVKQLSSLTIIQAAELSKLLEEEWGVSAAAPTVAAVSSVTETVTEQTEFDVNLDDIGDKKIEVIKVAREITGLGLVEAKNLVGSAPVIIKSGLSKVDAESIKEKLEAAGAKVTIK